MARKSRVQIDGESALANLNCIHGIVAEDNSQAAYHRNASDCRRWCVAIEAAKIPWPKWMVDGNLRYFGSIWNIRLV